MQTLYGRRTLQVALACLCLGFFVLFLVSTALTLIVFSPQSLPTGNELGHRRGFLTHIQL
jgi:hypothetical protein